MTPNASSYSSGRRSGFLRAGWVRRGAPGDAADPDPRRRASHPRRPRSGPQPQRRGHRLHARPRCDVRWPGGRASAVMSQGPQGGYSSVLRPMPTPTQSQTARIPAAAIATHAPTVTTAANVPTPPVAGSQPSLTPGRAPTAGHQCGPTATGGPATERRGVARSAGCGGRGRRRASRRRGRCPTGSGGGPGVTSIQSAFLFSEAAQTFLVAASFADP